MDFSATVVLILPRIPTDKELDDILHSMLSLCCWSAWNYSRAHSSKVHACLSRCAEFNRTQHNHHTALWFEDKGRIAHVQSQVVVSKTLNRMCLFYKFNERSTTNWKEMHFILQWLTKTRYFSINRTVLYWSKLSNICKGDIMGTVNKTEPLRNAQFWFYFCEPQINSSV